MSRTAKIIIAAVIAAIVIIIVCVWVNQSRKDYESSGQKQFDEDIDRLRDEAKENQEDLDEISKEVDEIIEADEAYDEYYKDKNN